MNAPLPVVAPEPSIHAYSRTGLPCLTSAQTSEHRHACVAEFAGAALTSLRQSVIEETEHESGPSIVPRAPFLRTSRDRRLA